MAEFLSVLCPRRDELLSSWIVRNSRSNRLRKPSDYTNLVFSDRQVWTRDIDWSAGHSMLGTIAVATETSTDVARQTTLRALEGRLYARHDPNRRTTWIRPVGVYHRTRRRPGLQFCPVCLGENDPYYRLSWRLGFVATCIQHQRLLAEACQNCQSPLSFHRLKLHQPMSICAFCNFHLDQTATRPATPDAVAFQHYLEQVLEAGVAHMSGYGRVPSVAYFKILHQVMKLIASGRAATGLRSIVQRSTGITIASDGQSTMCREIEWLPSKTRHDLLRSAAFLLERWPDTFINACERARIWRSAVMRDWEKPHDVPFAFYDAVRTLDRTCYVLSGQEVDAAKGYLRRQGMRSSINSLRRLTGIDSNLFSKEHG
jgi:hypothetical protein